MWKRAGRASYCVAKGATLRAARIDPSATVKLSLQDETEPGGGRRGMHKVYLYALPLMVVGQSLAVYMWRVNPAWWHGITRVIVG
jgi:hypothetical protein